MNIQLTENVFNNAKETRDFNIQRKIYTTACMTDGIFSHIYYMQNFEEDGIHIVEKTLSWTRLVINRCDMLT